MGFHSFLLWLFMLGQQSRSMDALSKNRSCVSYGSNALTEGLEHLHGLILEDGRNGTIQCPHNQCCFGIWELNQGQLQAKMQGEDKRKMQLGSLPWGVRVKWKQNISKHIVSFLFLANKGQWDIYIF